MSSQQKKKKKGKGKSYPNEKEDNNCLLDAYTDTTIEVKKEDKLVNSKNKNKKKLLERQKLEEEKSKEKEKPEEVAESWEDLEEETKPEVVSNPPPQQPQKPKQVESSKEKSLKSISTLLETLKNIEKEFKEQNSKVQNKVENPQKIEKVEKKVEKMTKNEPEKKCEKSKEEIKAEREAKKAAKAAKRANAKSEAGGAEQPKPEVKKEPAAEGGPSKADLKAERRAKQEAQRAAKEKAAQDKIAAQKEQQLKEKQKSRVCPEIQADRKSVEKKLEKKLASADITPRTNAQKKVMLFSHLHQYERELSISRNLPIVGGKIHPSIVRLGLQYAEGTISGSNARCVALLHAMKSVISDYVTPPQKELARDLDKSIEPYITFLKNCRTLSVSMGNAIRFLKTKINDIDPNLSDEEAKQSLLEDIDEFIHVNIVLAAKQISITASQKIQPNDVILTYGYSSLMKTVLIETFKAGIPFRVIVADNGPKFEGKQMIRHLVNAGIKCTYVLITAASCIIKEVSKVFVGAHAVLANGCVMSRVGTSQVALIAKAANVPVLVCCETYKFSTRVQTDSFVFNELGDPDELLSSSNNHTLDDWRDLGSLNLLNLTYDVTPASLVDAIISEISVIPGTSVPVVLRLKNMEIH